MAGVYARETSRIGRGKGGRKAEDRGDIWKGFLLLRPEKRGSLISMNPPKFSRPSTLCPRTTLAPNSPSNPHYRLIFPIFPFHNLLKLFRVFRNTSSTSSHSRLAFLIFPPHPLFLPTNDNGAIALNSTYRDDHTQARKVYSQSAFKACSLRQMHNAPPAPLGYS